MYILFLTVFLFLVSCSDTSFYNEGSQRIYVKAEVTPDTVTTGDSVLFKALILPDTSNIKHYYWKINDDSPQRRLEFKRSFNSIGTYRASFYAIDSLGDTIIMEKPLVVSKPPVLKNLTWTVFQGGHTFKWECDNPDTTSFILYSFKLRSKTNTTILDTTVSEKFLQLGRELPKEFFRVHLEAINQYNFKDIIDSTWSAL